MTEAMYELPPWKLEAEPPDTSTLCAGCLTSGRRMQCVGTLVDIFTLLASTDNAPVDASMAASMLICWECAAVIRRVSRLRTQLLSVCVLLQSMDVVRDCQRSDYSLSALKRHSKLGEDYVVQHGNDLQLVKHTHSDNVQMDATSAIPNTEIESGLRRSKRTVRPTFKLQQSELFDNDDSPQHPVRLLSDINSKIEESAETVEIGREETFGDEFGKDMIDEIGRECEVIDDEVVDDEIAIDSEAFETDLSDRREDDADWKAELNSEEESLPPRPVRRHGKTKSGKRSKLGRIAVITVSEAEMRRSRREMARARRYVAAPVRCESCLVGFSSQAVLDEHCAAKHSDAAGAYRCDICLIRTATATQLATHRRGHYTLHACPCGFALRSAHAVLRHYREQHAPQLLHKCATCDEEFPTDRSLRYHRECAHKATQRCQYCGREFNNSSTFKRHLMLHTGMPTYACPVCRKSYRGTHGLRAHMRTHAPGGSEDAFCIECNTQFKNKYLYRHHLKTSAAHASKESFRFPCALCDKRFFVASQLRAHEDAVHLKKRDFKCQHCDKAFTTPYKLKNHVRSAHESAPADKKHICETCGRGFATKQQVTRHQPVHTGERAFVCECGATFRQSAALYTHNRLVHLGEKRQKQ